MSGMRTTKRSSSLKKAGSSAIMSHNQFRRNAQKMKSNSSLAGTILTNLETQIQALTMEIRADEKGLRDYEQQLYVATVNYCCNQPKTDI